MSDDFRLWSTAIAVLALLLQSLLAGIPGTDHAAAATVDHSALAHVAGHHADQSDDEHHALPGCSLCCVSCAAVGLDPPPVPVARPAAAPRSRRPARQNGSDRRTLRRLGTHSARAPPRTFWFA